VSLTISPIKNAAGQVIGASKILRDIGERKGADEARFLLSAIVETSDDAIISKDLNGIITSWNAAAQRIFGYKPEEIIGRSVLMLIPPALQSEEPVILAKLRAGERIDHYETQRVTKNGEILDISLTISPIRDAKGKVIGASKIARDISERKRAQRALIESEKLAATGRMAAVIAHEINNPLEAVTNLGYLLSIHPSLDAEARNYAQLLLSEVERASDITRQTLAFYRDTTRPMDVHLSELIENLLDLHKNKLASQSISIVRELDREAIVRGYGAELRQVFVNLLLNAIDALHGEGDIRVRVRTVGPEKNMVRITVADTGVGISPEARKRLFEPFFTTKKNKGNGLGLWVSLGIVRKHSGQIRVHSSTHPRRHGTVFSVLLPRVPKDFAKADAA
jgi:PAS domain S-box-containing protein